MMTARERYKRDAQFKQLVDMNFVMIAEAQFTPTELREAAVLAAIKYEEIKPLSVHRETIICPKCKSWELALITHRDGDPFPSYVHSCTKCSYTIIESEWEKVEGEKFP